MTSAMYIEYYLVCYNSKQWCVLSSVVCINATQCVLHCMKWYPRRVLYCMHYHHRQRVLTLS